jgi:hypothetical protein
MICLENFDIFFPFPFTFTERPKAQVTCKICMYMSHVFADDFLHISWLSKWRYPLYCDVISWKPSKFLQCGFSSIGLGFFYIWGACVLRYLKTVSLWQSADTNGRCILMYFRMSVIFVMYSLFHRHNVNHLTISWELVFSCWLFYYVSVRWYTFLSVW